jgi:hypothetical protein
MSSQVFRARALGLTISSEFPLSPLLPTGDGRPGVRIEAGEPDPLADVRPTELGHRYLPDRALLAFEPLVGVERGRRVVVAGGLDQDPLGVSSVVLGPGLAVALLQRGEILLHSSAFVLDGEGVAIAAVSGGGKSSLATALYLGGRALVADDTLLLRPKDEETFVVPAYPLIKLWPDAAEALGLDPEELERAEPAPGKLLLPATDGFPEDQVPLRCVVALEYDDMEGVDELRGADAVATLVGNTYGLSALRAMGRLEDHLQAMTDVARTARIIRLRNRKDRSIEEVADRILALAG